MQNPIKHYLASLVFPPQCSGCDQQINDEPLTDASVDRQQVAWCQECLGQVLAGPLDRCDRCGAFIERNPYRGCCRACRDTNFRFETAIAINNYQGLLRDLIIRMKRDREDTLAYQFGRLLGSQVERFWTGNPPDLIVPVPTHWTRRLVRGFQASEIIAEGVGTVVGQAVGNRTLVSRKRTRKQGTLTNAARIANVRRAFSLHDQVDVRGRSVLLVDDVLTSGATASEASRVLAKAGAARIVVAVVARGAHSSQSA